MLWKKKQPVATALEGKAQETKVEVQEPQKAKKLSPKEIIIDRIEQLGPEESVSYRLPEVYGGGLAVVELNPQYPEKGKKYFLSLEKIVDGKPEGKRGRLWESNKPKDLAGWIVDRSGELYS
jgi:hypothetical protein